jgi:hypothetical protein
VIFPGTRTTEKVEPASPPAVSKTVDAWETYWAAILLLPAVLLLWFLPARSSFWLDETATFWVIKDGLGATLTRSMYWSGQSPLYYVTAWLALLAGGHNEWILRMPSLAAMFAAAWLLFNLAARLFNRAAAMSAVLAFICSEQVAFAAADARPYALGLCFLLGAALMLVQWLDSGLVRDAVGYSLFSVLAVYTHCLLALALLVFAVYAVYRVAGQGRTRLWTLLAAWTLSGVLILPLAEQFSQFYRNRAAHSFAGTPGLGDLLTGIAPPVVSLPVVLSVLAGWFSFRGLKNRRDSETPNVLMAAAWALLPPLFCFLLSVFTETKLFVPRYYIAAAPGLALLAGWAIRSATACTARRIAAPAMFVAAVLSSGIPFHGGEDWAGAMRAVRSVAGDSDMPVLVVSGFVEATDPSALDDPRIREVLFAPLTMYPPAGTIVPLPFCLDRESIAYLERVLPAALENQTQFLFVSGWNGMTFEPWLRKRLADRGFRSESLGNFGNVGVYLFSAGGLATPKKRYSDCSPQHKQISRPGRRQ